MRSWLACLAGIALMLSVSHAQTGEVVVPADHVVNSVGVRDEPSGEVIARLQKGEQATLILAVPNWYRIRLANGIEGFVPKSWTKRLTQSPGPVVAGQDIPFKVHFLDVGTPRAPCPALRRVQGLAGGDGVQP